MSAHPEILTKDTAAGWTADIARFVADLTYDNIPAEVRAVAATHIADTVAVTVAGLNSPLWKPLQAQCPQIEGTAGRVIGTDLRTSAAAAALANGTLSHAHDYDDDDPLLMVGHPSGPVVSAAAALADHTRANGQDFIVAYVAGVEVELRLGAAMNPQHYDHGWHATSTLGVIGAAVAAAKLLKLGFAQTRSAIGIAASLAGGLKANFGTMTKPLHSGAAARDGVLAAELAATGFTASPEALEHPLGFIAVFGSKLVEDVHRELSVLGTTWSLVDPGLAVKLYPSCSNTHPAIDAMLDLRATHHFFDTDVVAVQCRVSPGTEEILIHPRPTTPLQAKFSMQYCLAVAAANGAVSLGDFTERALAKREVRALMERIAVQNDPTIERSEYGVSTASRLVVELADGRHLSRSADRPKGSREHPLTRDDLSHKFASCCTALSADQSARAFAIWSDIASATRVSVALDFLTPPSGWLT